MRFCHVLESVFALVLVALSAFGAVVPPPDAEQMFEAVRRRAASIAGLHCTFTRVDTKYSSPAEGVAADPVEKIVVKSEVVIQKEMLSENYTVESSLTNGLHTKHQSVSYHSTALNEWVQKDLGSNMAAKSAPILGIRRGQPLSMENVTFLDAQCGLVSAFSLRDAPDTLWLPDNQSRIKDMTTSAGVTRMTIALADSPNSYVVDINTNKGFLVTAISILDPDGRTLAESSVTKTRRVGSLTVPLQVESKEYHFTEDGKKSITSTRSLTLDIISLDPSFPLSSFDLRPVGSTTDEILGTNIVGMKLCDLERAAAITASVSSLQTAGAHPTASSDKDTSASPDDGKTTGPAAHGEANSNVRWHIRALIVGSVIVCIGCARRIISWRVTRQSGLHRTNTKDA